MTILYGAGYLTCWKYFIEKINTSTLNNEDILSLKKTFKNYYNFINNNLGLLGQSSKKIITELQKENFIVKTDQIMSKIDLKYYKSTKKQIKYQIDGIRYTKNHTVLTNEIDIKKIKTSIRANYVHIHDASVVQYILKIKPILTIHDCFMIDYLSITYLISLINEAMRVQYHDLKLNENFKNEKIFSIFIVI